MNPQIIEIYKDEAFDGDSGIELHDLPRNWQICALFLKVRAKNTATGNSPDGVVMQSIPHCMKEIKVFSGSNIFKAYDGEICNRLSEYRNGKTNYSLQSQANGGSYVYGDPAAGWCEELFYIPFTLKDDPYGDRGVILPAPLYKSLILKMDYDFPTTAGAGFLAANKYFSLYALVVDAQTEDVMQSKRIMTETIREEFTSVASGNHPKDLTLDPSAFLKQILVHSYQAGMPEGYGISHMRYQADKKWKFDDSWLETQIRNARDCKLDWHQFIYANSISAHDQLFTRVPAVYATAKTVTDVADNQIFLTYDDDKVTLTTVGADHVTSLELMSDVLPGTAVIDFDLDESLRHIQPLNVRESRLSLTHSGASSTVKIVETKIEVPKGF